MTKRDYKRGFQKFDHIARPIFELETLGRSMHLFLPFHHAIVTEVDNGIPVEFFHFTGPIDASSELSTAHNSIADLIQSKKGATIERGTSFHKEFMAEREKSTVFVLDYPKQKTLSRNFVVTKMKEFNENRSTKPYNLLDHNCETFVHACTLKENVTHQMEHIWLDLMRKSRNKNNFFKDRNFNEVEQKHNAYLNDLKAHRYSYEDKKIEYQEQDADFLRMNGIAGVAFLISAALEIIPIQEEVIGHKVTQWKELIDSGYGTREMIDKTHNLLVLSLGVYQVFKTDNNGERVDYSQEYIPPRPQYQPQKAWYLTPQSEWRSYNSDNCTPHSTHPHYHWYCSPTYGWCYYIANKGWFQWNPEEDVWVSWNSR